MQQQKNLQTGTSNDVKVKWRDIAKSGFSLGYKSQISGKIGKLHATSCQFVMPGDRVSLGNSYGIQFEPLAVPMVGSMTLDSNNFYVKMRNIYGQDFEDFMSLSQGQAEVTSLPTFTLKGLVKEFQDHVFELPDRTKLPAASWSDVANSWLFSLSSKLGSYQAGYWNQDYLNQLNAVIVGLASEIPAISLESEYRSFVTKVCYLYFDSFLGEGSILDYFGYPIIDHKTMDAILANYWSAGGNFYDKVIDIPLSDAPLRGMYYIWYTFYRNIYTEPKAKVLNPRKWTAQPLSYATLLQLCVPYFRNWNIDMFTGAQIDDISRHAYAVIPGINDVDEDDNFGKFNSAPASYVPADANLPYEKESEGIISQNLHFIDVDGTSKVLNVKLPTMFGSDYLSNFGGTANYDYELARSLPLLQLRRAKMLEKFWKRVFFGAADLYPRFTKAIYDVDLSNALLNLPIWLSGSSNNITVGTETNNTSTAESPAGEKTAVMTGENAGDGCTCFCDEFGMIINIMSLLPDASYDGMPNQLLYSKLFDFPMPQFAQQDDELSHRFEIARTALQDNKAAALAPFAHHPYKHDWRQRVNTFHGNALSTRKMFNFGRLFDYSASSTPKMNASFLHCKPSLDMFIVSSPLLDVWYGFVEHEFYVERALPAYVEEV